MASLQRCTWCNLSAKPEAFQVCDSCDWTTKLDEKLRSERVVRYCVRYCSKECQEQDSKYHQLLCKKLKPFVEANPRPSFVSRLVLLLPQEKEEPELVWMQFYRQHCEEWADPYSILTGAKDVDYFYASYELEQQRPGPRNTLDRNLVVMAQKDPAPVSINACITKTVNGTLGHTWRGPVIACSQEGRYYQRPYPEIVGLPYQDFLLSDLRVAFEYFRDIKL